MNRSPNRLKQVLVAVVSCLVVILIHSIAPIQAQSQPVVAVNTVYYPITGATAGQLRQQMNQLGPLAKRQGSDLMRVLIGMCAGTINISVRETAAN
jgi:predicted secreted Zn-dependent protease